MSTTCLRRIDFISPANAVALGRGTSGDGFEAARDHLVKLGETEVLPAYLM